ncbi:hypothetical protein GCM10009727_69130 [Actinomadura napierensis]|uniref:Uncharacterized protein n=1 Tax=Actinomadura napierensis TaxID=267854 RepID=A0ABN3ABT0_9ACTN
MPIPTMDIDMRPTNPAATNGRAPGTDSSSRYGPAIRDSPPHREEGRPRRPSFDFSPMITLPGGKKCQDV